jgi:hypothetical protein
MRRMLVRDHERPRRHEGRRGRRGPLVYLQTAGAGSVKGVLRIWFQLAAHAAQTSR